ncbi:hypothetical protein [Desertivirga brevis]|uniref:hypothetical protein n=1 Tax=Desertivirga brevis TaxID=2810310 RepID=UPI001A96B6F1|nr:hypothetical protein [Pedobacter sp. SYSU D00873]
MKRIRSYAGPFLFLTLFLVGFFILPNIFNSRERKSFSNEERLIEARKHFELGSIPDSVEVVPGDFYRRGSLIQGLLGSAYRDLWQLKLKVPVLKLQQLKGGLKPIDFTGRHQTIGIKVIDSSGQTWSIRSVNKDQSAALPSFLRSSILRPMFRDQACSMNPFGGLVVARLAPALKIHCDTPRFYFFPYDSKLGKYNDRMAGRLVTLVKRWEDKPKSVASNFKILKTEEMLLASRTQHIPIDTIGYLRNRLFDMLISDWDRHEGNWKWMQKMEGGKVMLHPLAVDRDMAFYKFGEGVINKISNLFVNMFQSFTPELKSVEGLMEQSDSLDAALLKGVSREEFTRQAILIQKQLNEELIASSFRAYPPEVYALVGKEHEQIFKERLKELPAASSTFHKLIQEEVN